MTCARVGCSCVVEAFRCGAFLSTALETDDLAGAILGRFGFTFELVDALATELSEVFPTSASDPESEEDAAEEDGSTDFRFCFGL